MPRADGGGGVEVRERAIVEGVGEAQAQPTGVAVGKGRTGEGSRGEGR